MQAFDLLCLEWVLKVLKKKGMNDKCLNRIERYYTDSITIPVVNNVKSRHIKNTRMTVRQGDIPSTVWFGYGIDPLLDFLKKRLQGIELVSKIVSGPRNKGQTRKLEPITVKYKVMGYCDDLKPAITCDDDYNVIEKGVTLFEKSSGCRLHRDLASKKMQNSTIGKVEGSSPGHNTNKIFGKIRPS